MKTAQRVALIASIFAAVPLALALVGCGTNPEPTSVVCTDFRAGADLSGSTFGIPEGDLQRSYVAFAQAAGDLAAVANEMLHDVGASCQSLALALGADVADPRALGKLEPEEVRAWCEIAAERFTMVRPQLTRAHFAVRVAAPECTVDTSFQVECEQKCTANATCTEMSAEDRCPADARQGVCAGTCTGTCTGSETAPAACAGKCEGTCFGMCGEGERAAACDTGCVCASVCMGTCTAACDATQGGHCDALCSGQCSEALVAETCTKPLDLPKCAGDLDCQSSCGTSGAARATCPAGSLDVVVDVTADRDPELARIVGAMERDLPPIFLASRGRAKVLADRASSLLDSAGHLLNHTGDLGPMGAACGILIGQTGSEAQKNLDAALAGSNVLTNAVSGHPSPPATGK